MNERQKYNKKIISKLNELIEQYPDLRFGQILWNCNILYWEVHGFHDPFNDEPKDIWNRMK